MHVRQILRGAIVLATLVGLGAAVGPAAAAPVSQRAQFSPSPKVYMVKDHARGYDQYLAIVRRGAKITYSSYDPSHNMNECVTGKIKRGRLHGKSILKSGNTILSVDWSYSVRIRKRGNAVILGPKNYWSTFHRAHSHRVQSTALAQLASCRKMLSHATDD